MAHQRANLNRLPYFAAVAETGTITAAAARLAVSKAVVSKQIQQLEAELGVTLLVRTTRRLHLTEAGRALAGRARLILNEVAAAYEEVAAGAEEPRGTLRVTAPLGFGMQVVVGAVAAFRTRYPKVRIALTLSDTTLDVVETQLDLAVRVGWLRESSHKARKLCDFREIPFASPAFLAEHGPIETPADLAALPFIENRVLPHPTRWTFYDKAEQSHQVTCEAALSFDATPAIRSVVATGVGFGILPDFAVLPAIAGGELVRLLPDYHLRQGGVYLVFPNQRFRSAALVKFCELLTTHVNETNGSTPRQAAYRPPKEATAETITEASKTEEATAQSTSGIGKKGS
ncbi:LysR family transcriptional regulator [Acanthopleuribacter pedis]|uniref:LysR family transcriptional regulator n=1 Tax=Acanthopleuribacter pedis TaxID=442870 RepID=A0A8J7Q800_9BACT|nr:LysR family transcriptional regulator [Acanthopleuribacter pedis]MBO1319332.1 LysR family transcriptional regulator [Acanthopleuribacter pedis]